MYLIRHHKKNIRNNDKIIIHIEKSGWQFDKVIER